MRALKEYFGPYRKIKLLGKGGMACVYLAEDTRLSRLVAIKTLNKDFKQEDLQHLINEASIVSKLQHPNIVQLYDVVLDDDKEISALVMEYAKGGSLREVLNKRPLTLSETLRYMLDLCKALSAAHKVKVIHRDLKPENVLIDQNGLVKLSDFGIASLGKNKTIDSCASDRLVSGSIPYLAPEQACGEPSDERSDIFSLGILFYKMLTGVHPFKGETAQETMNNIVYGSYQQASLVSSGVPTSVDQIIALMLEKEPHRRFPNIESLQARLQQIKWDESAQTVAKIIPLQRRKHTSILKQTVTRFAILGVSASVILATLAFSYISFYKEARFIAVLPPQVSGEARNTQLISGSTLYAMYQALGENANYQLIDPNEVRAVQNYSPTKLLKALAADELLTSELICELNLCKLVAVRSAQGENGKLVQVSTSAAELRTDDLADVVGFTREFIRQFYGIQERNNDALNQWNDEDYRQFIQLWSAYISAEEPLRILDKIEKLAEPRVDFLPLLLLKSDLYRDIYNLTRKVEWQTRNSNLLKNVARRYSATYEIKSRQFELAISKHFLDEANALLRWLQAAEPQSSRTRFYEARWLFENARYKEAISLFEELANLRPGWRNLDNYALYLVMYGDYQRAEKVLNKLLDIYPNYQRALGLLADIDLTQGKMKSALEKYKALDNYQENYATMSNVGLSYLLLFDYQNAISAFQQALELGDNSYEASLNLGDAFTLSDMKNKAELHYQRVLTLLENSDIKDWRIFAARAQANARLGHYNTAVQDIQRAYQLAPEDPDLAFQSYIVYSLVGDKVSASLFRQKAVESGMSEDWFQHNWI